MGLTELTAIRTPPREMSEHGPMQSALRMLKKLMDEVR
jgi:hypothetical protein